MTGYNQMTVMNGIEAAEIQGNTHKYEFISALFLFTDCSKIKDSLNNNTRSPVVIIV